MRFRRLSCASSFATSTPGPKRAASMPRTTTARSLPRELTVRRALWSGQPCPADPASGDTASHAHLQPIYDPVCPQACATRSAPTSKKGRGDGDLLPLGLHQQECFADLGGKAGDLPRDGSGSARDARAADLPGAHARAARPRDTDGDQLPATLAGATPSGIPISPRNGGISIRRQVPPPGTRSTSPSARRVERSRKRPPKDRPAALAGARATRGTPPHRAAPSRAESPSGAQRGEGSASMGRSGVEVEDEDARACGLDLAHERTNLRPARHCPIPRTWSISISECRE